MTSFSNTQKNQDSNFIQLGSLPVQGGWKEWDKKRFKSCPILSNVVPFFPTLSHSFQHQQKYHSKKIFHSLAKLLTKLSQPKLEGTLYVDLDQGSAWQWTKHCHCQSLSWSWQRLVIVVFWLSKFPILIVLSLSNVSNFLLSLSRFWRDKVQVIFMGVMTGSLQSTRVINSWWPKIV